MQLNSAFSTLNSHCHYGSIPRSRPRVWALSLGLAMLSQRFRGAEIVAANAGFVIIFGAANLMVPSIAGVLLDINVRLCLPIFMISMSLI